MNEIFTSVPSNRQQASPLDDPSSRITMRDRPQIEPIGPGCRVGRPTLRRLEASEVQHPEPGLMKGDR